MDFEGGWGATYQCPLGAVSLMLSISADVRSSDDVVAFEGPQREVDFDGDCVKGWEVERRR